MDNYAPEKGAARADHFFLYKGGWGAAGAAGAVAVAGAVAGAVAAAPRPASMRAVIALFCSASAVNGRTTRC